MTNQAGLNQEYWDQRYKEDAIGWDLGDVSPPLKEYIDQLKNKDLRILIPGCGNAYEADYLLNKGFTDISIVDISPTLVSKLKDKYRLNNNIKIIHADFFELNGTFDLILEQTFFCALSPELRTDYRNKMLELLENDGVLAGLLFSRYFDNNGPPFGGSVLEYEKLFGNNFKEISMVEAQNSHGKRLGTELFVIFKK